MLPDQLTFLLPDLLRDFLLVYSLRVVENIKLYRAIQLLRNIPNDFILFRCACVDPNIMGGHTLQHILTLAYVNNLTHQLDTVNAWVFILVCQSFPAKHLSYIINILFIHFLTSSVGIK